MNTLDAAHCQYDDETRGDRERTPAEILSKEIGNDQGLADALKGFVTRCELSPHVTTTMVQLEFGVSNGDSIADFYESVATALRFLADTATRFAKAERLERDDSDS